MEHKVFWLKRLKWGKVCREKLKFLKFVFNKEEQVFIYQDFNNNTAGHWFLQKPKGYGCINIWVLVLKDKSKHIFYTCQIRKKCKIFTNVMQLFYSCMIECRKWTFNVYFTCGLQASLSNHMESTGSALYVIVLKCLSIHWSLFSCRLKKEDSDNTQLTWTHLGVVNLETFSQIHLRHTGWYYLDSWTLSFQELVMCYRKVWAMVGVRVGWAVGVKLMYSNRYIPLQIFAGPPKMFVFFLNQQVYIPGELQICLSH